MTFVLFLHQHPIKQSQVYKPLMFVQKYYKQNCKEVTGQRLERKNMQQEINNSEQELIIGRTTFTRRFFDQILPKISQELILYIQAGYWNFGDINLEWMKQVRKADCGHFQVSGNQSSIIKQISHIQFDQIFLLQLGCCKIYSIEAIAHLNLNWVGTMDLSGNFITSLKCFNKASINIESFDVTYNRLQDVTISRGAANFTQLTFNDCFPSSPCQIHDPSSLAKIKTQELQYLGFYYESAIFSMKIYKKLQHRFDHIKIHWTHGDSSIDSEQIDDQEIT